MAIAKKFISFIMREIERKNFLRCLMHGCDFDKLEVSPGGAMGYIKENFAMGLLIF